MLMYSDWAGTKTKRVEGRAGTSKCEVMKSTHEYENEIHKVFVNILNILFDDPEQTKTQNAEPRGLRSN